VLIVLKATIKKAETRIATTKIKKSRAPLIPARLIGFPQLGHEIASDDI
jgi:hypothetical protein